MLKEKQTNLTGELLQQLHLFQAIYELTVSLAILCAGDVPDQAELDRLLQDRQEIISQAVTGQKIMHNLTEDVAGCTTPGVVRDILFEIRSLLEKTAFLDEAARKDLENKRDSMKQGLLQLQTGKKASLVYSGTSQTEGFFVDTRKH